MEETQSIPHSTYFDCGCDKFETADERARRKSRLQGTLCMLNLLLPGHTNETFVCSFGDGPPILLIKSVWQQPLMFAISLRVPVNDLLPLSALLPTNFTDP
jgi:hypothetical protein